MKKLNMKIVLGIIIGVVVIQTVIICCLLFKGKDKEINVAETNNNETSENLVVNTTTDTVDENNTEPTDTEIDTNTELDGSENNTNVTTSTNNNATTSSNSNVSTSNQVTNEVKPTQKTEPTNNSGSTNNTSNTSTTNTNSNSNTSPNNTPSSNSTANNNSSNNTQNNTNNNTNTSTNTNTSNNTNTNTNTNSNASNNTNNSNSNTSSKPKEETKSETIEPDTKEEPSIEYEYINGFKILGYINIPKTGINLPVLEEYSIKALETSVVKMYGADLNKVGNAVITGHNYRNGMFFSNNKNLAVGDVIYITDAEGKKITYVIYDVFETEPSDASFITRGTNGKREISLSTSTDDAKNRLIVLAREK